MKFLVKLSFCLNSLNFLISFRFYLLFIFDSEERNVQVLCQLEHHTSHEEDVLNERLEREDSIEA